MKLLVCCMFLVASTQASAIARDGYARILRSENDVYPDGSYQYAYESDNGIEVEQSGVAGVSVSGSTRYVDSDGTPIELTYTADENGYHPQGAHLPVGPPIPDYILKALAYIESHPNKNDPYAYVHQPDPVHEVYASKPAKSPVATFGKPQVVKTPTVTYGKPQVVKASYATTRKPQANKSSVGNRGRYNY